MTESLEGLEQKRQHVYQQLQRLGNFRPEYPLLAPSSLLFKPSQ